MTRWRKPKAAGLKKQREKRLEKYKPGTRLYAGGTILEVGPRGGLHPVEGTKPARESSRSPSDQWWKTRKGIREKMGQGPTRKSYGAHKYVTLYNKDGEILVTIDARGDRSEKTMKEINEVLQHVQHRGADYEAGLPVNLRKPFEENTDLEPGVWLVEQDRDATRAFFDGYTINWDTLDFEGYNSPEYNPRYDKIGFDNEGRVVEGRDWSWRNYQAQTKSILNR